MFCLRGVGEGKDNLELSGLRQPLKNSSWSVFCSSNYYLPITSPLLAAHGMSWEGH